MRTRLARMLPIALLIVGTCAAQSHPSLTLPTPPDGGVNRGQPFDRKVPDPSVYGGSVYFVWGAEKPTGTPPILNAKYLPYSRDNDRKTHTFEWFKANHPDWIVYTADKKTPAWGFTYPNGNNMALDITNPAVRQFYWDTFIAPALAAGYKAMAFDNVDLGNWDKRSGHFDAQGNWVKQFSGDKIDSAYVRSVLEWMEYLTARLHAQGITVAANITFPIKHPELEPAMHILVETVDIWCDEQGFTDHSDSLFTDAVWQQKFDFLRSLPAGKFHWAVNEMSARHLADASPDQIDWAVANYYLYRGRNDLLTVCGEQEYGVFLDTPAMHVDLGHPLAPPVHDAGGAWTRAYSKGLVAVNPSSKIEVALQLQPGVWLDSHNQEHSGKIHIRPNSALLLMPKHS